MIDDSIVNCKIYYYERNYVMDTSTKKLSKDNPYYAKIEEEMKKRGARTGEEREKFYKDKVYNNKKNVDVRKDTKEIAPLSGYSHSFDDVKTAPKKDINITDKIKSVSPNSGYAQRFKEDNTNKKAASLSDKIKSVSPVSPAGQKINLNKNPDRLKELQTKKAANDMKRSADEARKFLQADNSVSQYELFNRMNNLTSDDVNRLLQSEEQRNKELKNSRTKLMYDRVGVTADKKKLLDNDLSESDARLQQYRIWLNENDLRQKAEEVKAKYSGLQNEPDYWERSTKAEKKLPYFRSEANDIYEYYVSRFSPETDKSDKYKNISLETDNAGKFLTHATPDEMRNYIYLYNKKGEKAAKEYYDMLEPDLRKRSANAEMEKAEKRGKEHPYISTAETIASYVPVSAVGGAAVAKSALTGKVDPYDPLYVAGAAREAEREATTNLIKNDALRLTYSAVTSAADNAVAALTVGKAVSAFGGAGMSAAAKAAWTGRITGGIMSSGVAANSVLEAKKEGFSDTSALAIGIARGSIEYLSEKFSIERIMKEPTTVLKALKKSVVSEGSEEVVSNWANRLVDNIINMGLTREYNELVESGMSEKEAFLTVAQKAAYEDLESFMGGAIAGSFMTAGHLGVQTAQVGGVKNMNQVLEYQSELSKLTDDEREKIIKQNEDRYNKERAVEILTRDNINMGDIAGALNFLGVSDPQQAAKDIERFKETGETSDLMKDKNVSSVVEVLATEGYFKNTDKVNDEVKNEVVKASARDVTDVKAIEAPEINVKADPMHGVNEDAVKVITDGIGSEGKKAYYNVLERESESAYQGSEATLLRDFNRFYIKGLNGGKLSEMSEKYAKVLTERSMTEAFKAGQSDRGAMLKEKFKAVNNAVIRDGGLIRNVNSENMTNEEISQIDNLGKKFGVSIEIQDHVYNNSNKEVNGVYEAGSIILNQSKMEEFGNVRAAEGFLVKHELTHRVRELAPKGFETLKSVVYDIEDRKSGNTSKAETVMTQRSVDVDTAIEEIVADHMGNEDFALEVAMKDLSLAERIKGWVSDILDRVGIKKYSETQRIKRLWEKACAEAKRTVKNSDKRVGNDVKAAGNAKYSDKMDFKHQVDASLDGKLQRGLSIYVGKTPNLLQKCGLDDLVMLINQAHLKNITAEKDINAHKHGLTREQVKQLPNELKHPVMIYDSISEKNKENSICVVTSLKDDEGNPIIAAIRANSNESNKYLDITLKTVTTNNSNYILSAYGKNNFIPFHLDEIIDNNALLYANKEKTSKLISDSGLQLPTRYNSLRFDTIIHQSNNIVNTSGQNNQKNSDGNLSEVMSENKRLRKENEKLKELKDHYKGQMLRTPNLYSPSSINIKKIINRVAIGYTGDKKVLTSQLKQAQELLSKCISVSLKADPKYTNEIYSRYREHLSLIAGDIANNTRTKNDKIYEQYRHIKDSLKGVTIKVNENWKNDLNGVDGYNDFRKKNFGVVKMSLVNGTPVDVLYSELGAKFGELFPEDITTEPEQLIHITETVRAMSNFYENPYNSDIDSVIEGIADSLDLELLTLSSERTQADKYFDEAQKQIETAMEERDRAVENIQEKYKRKIEEFKEEQRQKRENSAKRKEEATTRQKLLTLARRMKRIANNGRTTPANQALIQELIGHVDTIAVNMTGATVKNLQNLSEWYSNAAERINFVPNPRIEEDLARLDDEKIGEMNFERVMTLITALENIEKQIENENIEIGKKGDVYEKGMATMEHINNSGGSAAYGLNNAKDAIVTGLSNPVNEIHRLTGYADDDALYQTTKDIRKSELVEVYHEMKANKLFEEYTKDKKFMKHLREDFKTFTVKQYDALGNETGEKEIRLNPAMIISLAQLAKNSGSLLHMTEGGVRIADEKIYKHGKIKEAYDRGTVVKMVSPEIRKITSTLNEKDRAYMRKVEKYFNEFAKNEINAVSQQLDGIDRARVGFYYPMNTDSSFLVKEFDTISYDASVENQGSLKERVRNAKNPLLLMAAPDVVSRAISNNGKYIAYAIPLRNFKKLWNTMTRGDLVQVPETDKYKNVKLDENGDVIMKNVYKNNFEGSVKDSVERVWGHRAVEYVENFIKDIETGRSDKTGGATKVLNFLHGNYVKAVLTLNLPVAINQVASFPSAAPVLGWKPLLMSLKDLGKVDLELISQYTGAQWNRTKGAYDPTIADAYADNKALPKILDWMMASDSIITRKLWKASEYYVRIHKPGLEIGTHEYYRAVADIYETTMQETQPNSGVMERPAVLRADSATRLLMPFTGEPLKNVNLLYDAFGNMAAKKKQLDRVAGTRLQAEAEKRLKEAKKNLKTTIVSQVLASAAYTVFVALARIVFGGKNGRKKYEDEEGNLTVVSILKAMGKDFLITSLTQIPFTSDLVDFITAIIKGEKYYAPELISLQALTDATEACINTASLISNLIKGDGGTWQQTIEKINSSALKASTLVGIPLKNVENIANSLMYWGSKTVFYNNPTMQKYAVAKFSGTLVEKKKNEKTGEIEYTATAEAKKILYNAFVNGETDNYENILFDLVDSGVKASDLESAMRNLSQKDDDFAFDKSLGAFAGVKEGEDYEKYENYMKRAEKAEVSEEDLKKGIDIIDSGKPYKEMYAEITEFTKSMGEKQKTFFDNIARGKYSANELNKEQYKSYSKTRKEITEILEKQFDKTGLKNKEINDVQNKIYQYAEKTALENASNGEYRIDSEWIKQAGKSESTIGVNTAEFIKLYNKYGEKVYSEQSVITHEVGYNVNVSLEYSRLKSVKGTESERDEKGEIIKGKSKQDKIIAIIDGMDITDSEKAYLFSIDYKANNNNPWAGSQKVNYKKYLEQRKD